MAFDVNNHVSTLVKLGFSNNQAKVYLALAFLGTSSANNIVNLSQVPREEVYRKLDELKKMGFVERIFTRPAMFRALPVKSVLTTLHNRRIEESSELQTKIDNLLVEFEKRKKNENHASDIPEIILVPEKKSLLEKTKNEFENLKTSLDIVSSWTKGIAWISSFYDLFVKTLDRNVKIRFIIEKKESTFPTFVEELKKNQLFQIKETPVLPMACLSIYDQKRLLIDTSTTSSFTESPALWSNNPSIVGMAKVYFETDWINAK